MVIKSNNGYICYLYDDGFCSVYYLNGKQWTFAIFAMGCELEA